MLLVHNFLVLKYITLFVELHWCWVFEADTEIWEFTKHTNRDALIWADVLKGAWIQIKICLKTNL